MNATLTNFGRNSLLIFTVSALVFASCGNSNLSVKKLSEAEAKLDQIEQAEASDYANAHLIEAKSKLEEAKQLMVDKRHKKASLKADEAMVDAELAEVTTYSEKANEELSEIRTSIQSLKEKIQQINQDTENDESE